MKIAWIYCLVKLILTQKQILNKTLIFDKSVIDEEIIIDRTIDAINNPYNDRYWIEQKPGTNYFTLRLEDGW